MGEVVPSCCLQQAAATQVVCVKEMTWVCMKNEASDTAPALLAALHLSKGTKKPGMDGVVSLYCLQRCRLSGSDTGCSCRKIEVLGIYV